MREKEHSMAKQTMITLPEYGIQKIMHCADSYRSIAKIFLNFQEELTQKEIKNRQEKFYHRQMVENQNFMAEQFLNIADTLTEMISQSYQFVPEEDKQYKQLVKYMKKSGIEVKHIYLMDNEKRDGVLEVTMRAISKQRIPVADIAELLGIYYDMRLKASVKSPYFLEDEYQSFTFVQEPAYCFLYGQATAVKEGEEISGDSMLVSEGIDGHVFFMLSDGVGSGETAYRHSEKVVDFIEKFLLAGYSKKTAVQVLNGLLLQDSEESAMSTLDLCELDLYKGVCEFHKVGATVSFHKRDCLVEKIWIENLPLGAFHMIDLAVVRRKLEEGDYIIMLTDGLIESLMALGMEEKLTEYISALTLKNPRDMAQSILRYGISLCQGNISDDMSVLVFGIWRS